ncbi:MAG: AbrB/MazE/SpoVT family DNA-binding domain-containing protein [Desulfovermiculus sp.]
MHATVTSKGQITLPKALRERLKLSAGDRVEFIVDDEHCARLVVTSVPVTSLKGMLPRPSQPVSLEDMDRAVQEGAQNL